MSDTSDAIGRGPADTLAPRSRPVDHDETARAMVSRVKAAFEYGYAPGKLVRYEQNAVGGFAADEVFFSTMIYRSVFKSLSEGNLPKNEPEPPQGAKVAAIEHGKAAAGEQEEETPLKLVTILKTFFEIKSKYCATPGRSDKPTIEGFVCRL